jgi:hypothetical protein
MVRDWVVDNVPPRNREWIFKVVSESLADSRDERELGQVFASEWINNDREDVIERVTEATDDNRTVAEGLVEVAVGIRSY